MKPASTADSALQARMQQAAWLLMALALLACLKLALLPALFAGLLVYELVHILAGWLPRWLPKRLLRGRFGGQAKLLAVGALTALVLAGLFASAAGLWTFYRSDAGSLPSLLQRMAEIIASLPPWLSEHLPSAPEGIHQAAIDWLREHALELQNLGKETGRGLAHVLIGMVIGAMLALQEAQTSAGGGALTRALVERARRLAEAFRGMVFAQVRISALNCLFTALYLALLLPLSGVQLPFVKSMILLTFLAGLIPVIGNLISNTVIVVVSLSHSPQAALGSLVFLVLIHKLEYFLNARIIGDRIHARAWELLLAMLLMEAAFGLAGVIAAPIVYAYVKDELRAVGVI